MCISQGLENIVRSGEVHHHHLKVVHWNIEGIKSRLWGNKLNTEEFQTLSKDYNIIGLTETHSVEENLELTGYTSFQLNRKNLNNSARGSGGIAVFVKQNLCYGITLHKTANENILWLKLKKSFFNFPKDIYLGTVYFSPVNYERSHKLDYLNDLENDLINISTMGEIILMGDFNSRTGILQDVLESNRILELENLDSSESRYKPYLKQRNSQDYTSDKRGERLIELCLSLELSILNGRKIGDSFGMKTCFNWNGSSVVDYVISSNNIFESIRYFRVDSLQPTFSIHCPVSFSMHFDSSISNSYKDANMHNIKYKYKWSKIGNENFKKELASETCKTNIHNISTDLENNDISHVLQQVYNVFYSTATKTGIKVDLVKKCNKRNTISKLKPWYDLECKNSKTNLRKLAKMTSKYHTSQEINTLFHKNKKDYKRLVKSKRQTYKNSLVHEIKTSSYDPKILWSKIKDLKDLETDNPKDTSHINANVWFEYFKKLGDTKNGTTPIRINNSEGDLDSMDSMFSANELKAAIKKLKNNKSAGPDQITNEMIRCFYGEHSSFLLDLFNFIFRKGQYPKEWSSGMIVPIHKKGPKNNPSNYRGITLSSCLGKLFCNILNNRLSNYVKERHVLGPEQLGFVAGNRTSDAIFILQSLVEKYCKILNQKLYVCFVDFEKAFDRVSRNLLLHKLHSSGVKGNFWNILCSMYSDDKACIKLGNAVTDSYPINVGVKQGCVLSPTLFNLFLSDLPSLFNSLEMDAPKLLSHAVTSLFWADDLAVMSTSARGLQLAMDNLKSYCDINELSVNLNKTKFMVFNRSGKLLKNTTLCYGNSQIDLVPNFIYLGIRFSASGSWNEALKDLKARGLRAYFKMKKILGNLFTQDVVLSLKLFDALVKPVLLYCSDIWGANNKLTETSPIEQVHIKFCKHILQVNKQTSNIGVRAELGRIPLITLARIQALKNWVRISLNNCNKLTYSIYRESLNIINSWSNNVKEILFKHGLGNVWQKYSSKGNSIGGDLNQIKHIANTVSKTIKQRFTDCAHQDTITSVKESPKLRTYVKCKDKNELENYLISCKSSLYKKCIAKLRLSNHKLQIETGRYTGNSVEERICTTCQAVEDEFHLLIKCKRYSSQRESLYTDVSYSIPKFTVYSDTKKFEILFSPNNLICDNVGVFLSATHIC